VESVEGKEERKRAALSNRILHVSINTVIGRSHAPTEIVNIPFAVPKDHFKNKNRQK
jgi:hypothetical protein